MSGKSNVIFWLERRGMTASEELVDRIFQRARLQTAALRRRRFSRAGQRFRPILSLITVSADQGVAQLFSAARFPVITL